MIRAYRPQTRATLRDWLAVYRGTFRKGLPVLLFIPAVLVAAVIGEVL
jgi:hypothetical protein